VESLSLTTGMMIEFRAVLTDQLELSVAYPSVSATLGLAPMTLPPGAFGTHRLSPMGRFMPRRFNGILITQLPLGIQDALMTLLVFDDNVRQCGVDIFLGRHFMNMYLGGRLPPLLLHQPTDETFPERSLFWQGY
jgi:hypothetical protein